MKELKVQVESWDDFKRSSLAMAERIDGGDWTPEAARYSFASVEQMFSVLTLNRWIVLNALRSFGPTSIRALSQRLKRDYRGVHSDVMALIEAGLIERDAAMKISVPWSKITAELVFDAAAA